MLLFFSLILLILIKKSLSSLETELSTLILHIEDDNVNDDPEDNINKEQSADSDVKNHLLKNSAENSLV